MRWSKSWSVGGGPTRLVPHYEKHFQPRWNHPLMELKTRWPYEGNKKAHLQRGHEHDMRAQKGIRQASPNRWVGRKMEKGPRGHVQGRGIRKSEKHVHVA